MQPCEKVHVVVHPHRRHGSRVQTGWNARLDMSPCFRHPAVTLPRLLTPIFAALGRAVIVSPVTLLALS